MGDQQQVMPEVDPQEEEVEEEEEEEDPARPWQRGKSNVKSRISFLRRSGHLSDLTIAFPGDTRTIKVHRLVLAMSSPVLEAMLNDPLENPNILALPGVPPQAFEWLMDHIYHDEPQLPEVSVAVQVYQLASKYQMDTLSRMCSRFLLEKVNIENFPFVYNTAVFLEDTELLNKCSLVLAPSADQIMSSQDIGVMNGTALTSLLQHPSLSISTETLVYRALITWGRAQLVDPTPESLRQVVGEFLPLVRFKTMTTDEFVEHVIPSMILSNDECITLLKTIKGVAETLPDIASCDISVRRPSREKAAELLNNQGNVTSTFASEAKVSILRNFKTSKPVYISKLLSNTFSSLLPGSAEVKDAEDKTVGTGSWHGMSCYFSQPVRLEPDKTYSLDVSVMELRWVNGYGAFNVQLEESCFTGEALHGRILLHFLEDSPPEDSAPLEDTPTGDD